MNFRSPSARTAIFYATFYSTPAVSNPFLAIWLSDKGLSSTQIGFVNALPVFLMILLNVAVGRVADHAKDWRSVIVAGAVIAAITPLLLFAANDYLALLIAWALVTIPHQAIGPVIDSAALRMTRRIGVEFGGVRVWGTYGFIAVTLLAGLALDYLGPSVFVPLIVTVSFIRAAAALQLPLFRAQPGDEDKAPAARTGHPLMADTARHLFRPWFLLPLIGTALLHGSHMMQMGFGALVWQKAGLPGAVIGVLWAVAPVAEILAMLFFARIARRFPARHLILLSCLLGVVRWAGFAMEPPVWGLILLQGLHVATFGIAYMGTLNFIGNWTSEKMAAEAQSFSVMLRQVAGVVGLIGFGWLYGIIGVSTFYAAAFMALAGAVLTLVSLMMMHPRNERTESAAASVD